MRTPLDHGDLRTLAHPPQAGGARCSACHAAYDDHTRRLERTAAGCLIRHHDDLSSQVGARNLAPPSCHAYQRTWCVFVDVFFLAPPSHVCSSSSASLAIDLRARRRGPLLLHTPHRTGTCATCWPTSLTRGVVSRKRCAHLKAASSVQRHAELAAAHTHRAADGEHTLHRVKSTMAPDKVPCVLCV